MDANKVPRTIRLLQRAEGYLELQLPVRAIAELDAIADAGPFEPAVALLRGEALKSQERYEEALVPLREAATLIPAPLNKRAWRSISECYRHTGQPDLADMADVIVNAEDVEAAEQPNVTIYFAVVPLPLVQQALKLILGHRGLGKIANEEETTDETPEDQTTPGE
ncbi:MAG TPA: hypothetical protein VFG04_02685 [Planctomycetaceae bacterium]|jgi:hypothetical protein|nr:hypothetical protein [Planctomycetaceae bacterium]